MSEFNSSNNQLGGKYQAGMSFGFTNFNCIIKCNDNVKDTHLSEIFIDTIDDNSIQLELYSTICSGEESEIEKHIQVIVPEDKRKQLVQYLREIADMLERKI